MTTKPGAASFASELPTANWRDIWLSLIGLAVVSVLTGLVVIAAFRAIFTAEVIGQFPPDQQRMIEQLLQLASVATLASLITVPAGFFLVVGVLFLVAKLFGGTGTFLQQAYAFALFYVPITGVSMIAVLVPGLGIIVGNLLGLYSFVLAVFAISASQRLTTGRSVAVVVLPIAVLVVLACVLTIVFAPFIDTFLRTHF